MNQLFLGYFSVLQVLTRRTCVFLKLSHACFGIRVYSHATEIVLVAVFARAYQYTVYDRSSTQESSRVGLSCRIYSLSFRN